MKPLYLLIQLLIIAAFSGCTPKNAPTIPPNTISKIPPQFEFYITPTKKYYLPYERVSLNLRVKNKGAFEQLLNIKENRISEIQITPLTTSNDQETYHVDWKNVHRNGHGPREKTNRIRWDLTNNWSGLISQTTQKNSVQFIIKTPVGYWVTDEFTINIHLPLEEQEPHRELMSSGCNLFFEFEYAARTYNKKWSACL